jgi:hypothetical protein
MKKLFLAFIPLLFTLKLLAQQNPPNACNLSDSKTPDCNLVYFGDFENLKESCYLKFTNFVLHSEGGNTPDLCYGSNKNTTNFANTLLSQGNDFQPYTDPSCHCVEDKSKSVVTKNDNFMHIGSKLTKKPYLEGICLPLKKQLDKSKKYLLSYEIYSGCIGVAGIALSKNEPCNITNAPAFPLPNTVAPVSVDCGNGVEFDPQTFPINTSGSLKWEQHSFVFTPEKEDINYITIHGLFSDDKTNNKYPNYCIYFDNIVITEIPNINPIVTSTITKNCVGGELEIKYEICIPPNSDEFEVVGLQISPTIPLSAGVTYKSTNFKAFKLPTIAGGKTFSCREFTMTFNIDKSVKTYTQEDIVVNIIYRRPCIEDVSIPKATPVIHKTG